MRDAAWGSRRVSPESRGQNQESRTQSGRVLGRMARYAPSPVPAADAARPARIVAERLSKSFVTRSGPVEALRDVDLVIPDGQFCCIVGPSGCGKTTLLRILGGLEEHSDGRLELLHADPRR